MLMTLFHQASSSTSTSGGATAAYAAFGIIGLIIYVAAFWRLFSKLGLPGWMGIIPFVNTYMIYKTRGVRSPVLWLILSFIPCLNIIALWFMVSDLAEMYGKHIGWKLFLFFLTPLAALILAFGGSQAVPANMAGRHDANPAV